MHAHRQLRSLAVPLSSRSEQRVAGGEMELGRSGKEVEMERKGTLGKKHHYSSSVLIS